MQMRALTAKSLSAAAAVAALVLGSAAPAARAESAVAACQVTTYYADARMTIMVGTTSTCPATPEDGERRRKHAEPELFETSDPRPGASLPAGTLPCEFQADCLTTAAASPESSDTH